jgi:mono/diheme cytochrome c family protein
MKSRSIITLFMALVLVASFPCLALAADAAATFNSRCAPCHARDGSGNTPMGKKVGAKALGSAEVQKLSDADLQKTITKGQGKMPEFGTKLSPEQIGEVVKLIRGFAAK